MAPQNTEKSHSEYFIKVEELASVEKMDIDVSIPQAKAESENERNKIKELSHKKLVEPCKAISNIVTDVKANLDSLHMRPEAQVPTASHEEASDDGNNDDNSKKSADENGPNPPPAIILKELQEEVDALYKVNTNLKRKVTMFQQLFKNEEKLFKVVNRLEEREQERKSLLL